jgi:Mor family transcriptional regulator
MKYTRSLMATEENTLVDDFPEDSLAYFIAEKDIPLALAVCSQFGGMEEYVPKIETINRQVIYRYIISRLDKMESARQIAKAVPLGVSQVSRIIRRHLGKGDNSLNDLFDEIT